MRNSQRTAR
ncbi:hypothetical protein YPPY47_0196, partial [Yersinia pestis PY-47]